MFRALFDYAILFSQMFVDAFNLNYRVTNLYRNELSTVGNGTLFTDLVFETAEGVLLNFEFQDVKITENHLKRYMDYKVQLQCQSGMPVVTVIICTYHIKSEIYLYKETETSILHPIIHYLIDYYDSEKYISLKNKIENSENLTKNEIQYLILMPFMVKRKSREKTVTEICNLIEKIRTKKLFNKEELYLPLILAIRHYITDEKKRQKLIKVLTMSMPADKIYEKVINSGIYEKGIKIGKEDGIKIGAENTLRGNVFSMIRYGFSDVEISDILDIDLDIIQNIIYG